MADVIQSEYEGETNSDSAVAFNVPDLKAMAAKILRRANEVAQQKMAAAQQNITQLEQKAHAEGMAKGLEEGRKKGEAEGRASGEQAVRAEFTEKNASVGAAMQTVLREVASRKVALNAEAEADLLRLSIEIARRIVRREVEVDDQFVVPIVREAIGLTNNRSDLIVRLNPADLESVELELPALHATFSDLGRVELKSDTTVERGGARVQSREGEVDLRLAQQFDALERALVGDVAGLDIKPLAELEAEAALRQSQQDSAGGAPDLNDSISAAGSVDAQQGVAPEAGVAQGVVDQTQSTPEPVAEMAQELLAVGQPQDQNAQIAPDAPDVPDVPDVQAQPTPATLEQSKPDAVGAPATSAQSPADSGANASSLSSFTTLDDIPLDASASELINQTLKETGGGS